MNENLDLIKILKDCPEGTKLYSTIYGDVYFKGIKTVSKYPITFTRSDGFSSSVTSKGVYMIEFNGDCTLFPSREQRDWSKWQRPFKDGDIIFTRTQYIWVSIFKKYNNEKCETYMDLNIEKNRLFNDTPSLCSISEIKEQRLATEDEKQKLFDVIREKGYKWNFDTKSLEKLPKFKDGDVIINDRGSICIYKGPMFYNKNLIDFYCGYRIIDCCFLVKHFGDKHFGDINEYRLVSEERKQKFFDAVKSEGYKWNAKKKELEQLIKPKFKVGDIIQDKDGYKVKITEVNVEDELYGYESLIAHGIGGIAFNEQNDWKLVPNKFNPKILIPFKSKVLVRDANHFSWIGSIYTHHKENNFYTVNGTYYRQCIPYNNDTAYLIGTCKIAPDYYRYWED